MQKFLLKKTGLLTFFILLSSYSAFAYDVIVARDGSGNFTTVQAAVDAAPTGRTTPYSIFIKNGKYKEKINVPSNKPFLQFIGESVSNVILTFDDFSGKPMPGGGTFGTSNSASVTIAAADFTAVNITFENTTGESPQALALNVTGDRAAFKNCRFLGGQDTLFAGGNGARQYFKNCYIDGSVDFIFGDARAVFDSTIVYAKSRATAGASYITAANTKQTEAYGYVFRDCVIPANRGTTVYYLGRPWQNDAATADAAKSYNKVVFLNTTMSSSIQTAGWSTWDAGTDVTKVLFAEYRSKKFDSSLVDVSGRVSWSKQLTAAEATNYNNNNLFGTWNPCNATADFCAYTPRPIAVSNFKGVKGSSTSTFTWNISWPIANVKYEILRSSDKLTFSKVSEQTSANDSTINYTYAEAVPPPGVTYYYLIQASKAGYNTHITDTVSISSTPTISVTGSMGNFVQGIGTPSASQSYIVSGSSLTNNLIITAPVPYEISTNGSTWNTSNSPLAFTRDANGNIPNTTVFVRLNAVVAGTYGGNIIHTSQGADTVKLSVAGTVQNEPLTVSEILQWHPMTVNSSDSVALRSVGITASTPTLNNFSVSNGIQYDGVPLPAYSSAHGQALSGSPGGTGDWTTASGGPGGNLSRAHYEQFTVTAAAGYTIRVDSLILTNSFYLTASNTRIAVQYSLTGFAADSVEISGGVTNGTPLTFVSNGGFTKAVAVPNENGATTNNFRFALKGGTGITVPAGQTLSVRLYFSCGSGSRNRYAKIKDLVFKGLTTKNPLTGDYRTFQTGVWTDLNTWERFNGTSWVNPVPEYPHFNNTSGTIIMNGHTVTLGATLPLGFGYIPRRTRINNGGQLIVNNGANLNIAGDGTPAAATTDLQIDGTLTLLGGIFTNGNVAIGISGTFVNSGTNLNLSNSGDTVFVLGNGTYQQNTNSANTPARFSFEPTSTFRVTGLTTAQTGLFKNNVKYGNIVWNNPGATAYYAIRTTLDSSNIAGSFTVQSTGSTYLSFANSSSRISIPGGYYQTGGTVNYRESGNITDTLDLGGDFNITGGTFNSNAATGSSLQIRLNGFNKTITYSQNAATNTDFQVNGSYTSGSNLSLPGSGFGVAVNGTLNAGTFAIGGIGNFNLNGNAVLSSGSPLGINGNITVTGTKTLSTTANYIFNGTAAQVTGDLLPATVNSLTINNASDVTLNGGNVNVTGALTLTSGKLIADNYTITASSVLSATTAKYVVTKGTGALKINNIGAGNNLFAAGPTNTSYNPVLINNAGTADNISVSVKTTFDNPVPNANKVVNRQWIINEEVAGGSNATISLTWTTADQAPGFDPTGASSIIRFNGSSWEIYPATITGVGTTANPYVATASSIIAFSQFTVINNTGIPLILLNFKAGYDNYNLNVSWSTKNEFNAASYTIERSIDGSTFTSIGSVTAKNAAGQFDYTFIDANPVNGVVYYRLKIIDRDGTFRYSNTVMVITREEGKVSVYPNPAVNLITLTHARANDNASFEVYTLDGKKVMSKGLSLNAIQTSVNVSMLPPGIYMIVVTTEVRTKIQIIKQ